MNYIYRNSTIEYLFNEDLFKFSGYEDVMVNVNGYTSYLWFYTIPLTLDTDEVLKTIDKALENLNYVISSQRLDNELFALTMPLVYGLNVEGSNRKVVDKIISYNKCLDKFSEEYNYFHTIDINKFYYKYGYENIVDWKYYLLFKMPINPRFKIQFKDWLEIELKSMRGQRMKCIVLDLDNTLWGGILGEDGIYGIEVGKVYPGIVFYEFQRRLLEYYNSGIILAICSKNNVENVLEVFTQNKNIVLSLDMFSSKKINWINKAENIISISQELNIGLDSMVFVDDNPAERDLVRSLAPEITVLDFPVNHHEIPKFILNQIDPLFRVEKFSNEDLKKNQMYFENSLRDNEKKTFKDIDDFIRNLNIVITFNKVNNENIARCSQLTQKTNQFNLSTKRYSESEINHLIEKNEDVFIIGVEDKYGTYGYVSVIIVKKNNILFLDTFLLSCRVLGKKIEYSILKELFFYYKNIGVSELFGKYIKTNKNQQVLEFLKECGMILTDKSLSANPNEYDFISKNIDLIKNIDLHKVIWNI